MLHGIKNPNHALVLMKMNEIYLIWIFVVPQVGFIETTGAE